MSKYLKFKEVPFEGKTKRFEVISKNHGFILGRILWYGAWRCYVFHPQTETIYNKDCLKDVQDFLNKLMDDRKQEKINNDWHNPQSPYYIDGVDK